MSECNDIIRLRNVFEEGGKARRREAWGVRYEVRMHMSTVLYFGSNIFSTFVIERSLRIIRINILLKYHIL